MTPQQFIAKWQRVNLSERSACQQHFLDLCELLDQPKPADGRPRRHVVHLREGRAEDRRRRRLGRRLDARPFRLGIQGQAQGPRGGLQATAALPRGPGEPAAAGRLRHGPLRGPHQLHRHAPSGSTRSTSPGWPSRPTSTSSASSSPIPTPCGRASPARRSPSRRPSGSASWPTACGSKGDRAAAGRPLPDEAHVLHVRRGHRAAAGRSSSAGCWTTAKANPAMLDPAAGNPLRGHGQGRRLRRRRRSPGSTAACSPTPT